MKIEKFLLKPFNDENPPLIHLNIPDGSIFQKMLILPEGIVALYLVPEIQTISVRVDTYTILQPGQSLIHGTVLVDILTGVFNNPTNPTQSVVMLFPIYEIKESVEIKKIKNNLKKV